jgi:hypothetical protein|tara:strand:+ start:4369 stop:4557 length:189 start_codon:yes stop_codon:yes gene_type:complete
MCQFVARQTCLALAATAAQACVAALFVATSFYFASIVLTPVRILGITQLPPGIVYGNPDMRF